MIILALELSTVRASVALCDDDRVLAEDAWIEEQARHQHVFESVPALLRKVSLGWEDLGLYAAGRGPGAFSGIRIALMAAQMFALPLKRPVVAVSSGEALAAEFADGPTLVCGDARRGTFWYGLFGAGEFSGWRYTKPEAWPDVVPAGARIVTSQWDRLAALRSQPVGGTWIEGDRHPSATAVARLALASHRAGRTEPAEPIYLHPPV
jgi:tRNA threonylcarbamoyladenosine biosynthesis protein TsaB